MIALAHVAATPACPYPAPRPASRAHAAYRIEFASDWASVAAEWTGASTPFQDAAWLGAWYGALGARPQVTPLLVTARDDATGDLALRLPLIRHRRGRLDVIEFADLHLADFNAPVLGPAAPADRAGARVLWQDIRRAIRAALPRADLVRFTKMPPMLGERPNPLALLPGLMPNPLNGNLVRIGEDWALWRRGLPKVVRKELDRSWRVFRREPGAAFELVTDPGRLRIVIAAMEAQQQARMRAKGRDYILAEPDIRRFYRQIVEDGVPSGRAVVAALTAGETIVASLLSLRDAQGCVMVRIGIAGGHWAACSPGRLIVDRTMAALHAQGCRLFDLSLGNYDYKRRFGIEPVPLVDLIRPLGPRGVPAALRALALGELRKRPALDAWMRARLGRA